MNQPNRLKRLAALGISWGLAMTLAAPAVLADPPEDVLDQAREAVAKGQQAAEDLGDTDAVGNERKAKGLENATAAIEAFAARKAEREDKEFPGNGNAFGRGHAAEVHAILAAGGSPSELAPHGEKVSALAKAFDRVKADHPGQGEGLDKEKPAKGSDDDAEAD